MEKLFNLYDKADLVAKLKKNYLIVSRSGEEGWKPQLKWLEDAETDIRAMNIKIWRY